jgi:hypothetical protein
MTQDGRVLTVIVCGAGPASEVGQLIKLAQEHRWTVHVVATPAAPGSYGNPHWGRSIPQICSRPECAGSSGGSSSTRSSW